MRTMLTLEKAFKTLTAVLPLLMLMYTGCLESNLIPELKIEKDNSAEMLHFFERGGDFINSPEAPASITAENIYLNAGQFRIIDTRTEEEFKAGHIKGAVNVRNTSLLNYFKSGNIQASEKAVIVSAAGQAASYYTCLLRLLGYRNVFALKFGMASWHQDFAAIWEKALFTDIEKYTNQVFPRNPAGRLPRVTFISDEGGIKEKIENRAAGLFAEGFQEDLSAVSGGNLSGPAIERRMILNSEDTGKFYIVCYSQADLYFALGLFSPFTPKGHPAGAVLYGSNEDLKSSKYLQNLPADKPVAIYCYNGHLSAAAAAYLRMLGYDAKSLLFGANSMMYDRMRYETTLERQAFGSWQTGNYPYEKGE